MKNLSKLILLILLVFQIILPVSYSDEYFSDRITTDSILDDKEIVLKLVGWSKEDSKLNDAHLNFMSFDRVVLVTGEVSSDSLRSYISSKVQVVSPKVDKVVNETVVAANSDFFSRIKDSAIVTQLEALYKDQNIFSPSHVKAISENQTVFLMGKVTKHEANEATVIASKVKGVRKIIKLFDYLKTRPIAEKSHDHPRELSDKTPLILKKQILASGGNTDIIKKTSFADKKTSVNNRKVGKSKPTVVDVVYHNGLKRLLSKYYEKDDFGCLVIKPNKDAMPFEGYIIQKCYGLNKFNIVEEQERIDSIAGVLFSTLVFNKKTKLDGEYGKRIFISSNKKLINDLGNTDLIHAGFTFDEIIRDANENKKNYTPFTIGAKAYFSDLYRIYNKNDCVKQRETGRAGGVSFFYSCVDRPYSIHSEMNFDGDMAYTGFHYYAKKNTKKSLTNTNSYLKNTKKKLEWVKIVESRFDKPIKFSNKDGFSGLWKQYGGLVLDSKDVSENQMGNYTSNIFADTKGPIISLDQSNLVTVENSNFILSGSVYDDSNVSGVSVNGGLIEVDVSGQFNRAMYVGLGENKFIIEATDIFGNKATKVITVVRNKTIVKNEDKKIIPPTVQMTSNPNSIALIIGLDNYKTMPNAPWAESDASTFYDYAHNVLGIPFDRIRLITGQDSDGIGIWKSLEQWLPSQVDKNKSNIYVYFAGHGLASEDGKEAYLMPYDGDTSMLSRTAIPRKDVISGLDSLKARSVTLFMDTCYSGSAKGGKQALVASRGLRIVKKNALTDLPSNFTLFSAAANDETAISHPTQKNGLFSYWMMRGLGGEADVNNDRTLTNGELHTFVSEKVKKTAISKGHKQNPQLTGNKDKVISSW